jgi:hypothetical protein
MANNSGASINPYQPQYLQNPVLDCTINFAVRSKIATGGMKAQPDNFVVLAKLKFCKWLNRMLC